MVTQKLLQSSLISSEWVYSAIRVSQMGSRLWIWTSSEYLTKSYFLVGKWRNYLRVKNVPLLCITEAGLSQWCFPSSCISWLPAGLGQ